MSDGASETLLAATHYDAADYDIALSGRRDGATHLESLLEDADFLLTPTVDRIAPRGIAPLITGPDRRWRRFDRLSQ